MGKVRRAKIELMYREYIRVSGLNQEENMSDEEKIERKRAFMSGIYFLGQYINDNFTRVNFKRMGTMLLDVDDQLRKYWDGERKRENERFESHFGENVKIINEPIDDEEEEDFQSDDNIE